MKIDHFGKSIADANFAVWVKIFFPQKHAENESTGTIDLFCAKNRYKKQPIFEKLDHFDKYPLEKSLFLR